MVQRPMRFLGIALGLTLAFSTACKSSGQEAAEKLVTMFEELGVAIESAGDDCGKMADGVKGVLAKYPDLEKIKAEAEKAMGTESQAKELEARVEKAMPKLMGMMKCAGDAKMKEVEEKLKTLL